MYKIAAILYVVCFILYVLFSRVPDYFDGDFTRGIVSKASFVIKDEHPELVVDYSVGPQKFKYTTNDWFLTSYKQGQVVTIIYNPSNPSIASLYAFIGYWIKWNELIFTAIVFIILFFAAVLITGKTNTITSTSTDSNRKRNYDR